MIWQRQLLTYAESLDRIKSLNAGYVLISEFDDDPAHWPKIQENKNLNFGCSCCSGKQKTPGREHWHPQPEH